MVSILDPLLKGQTSGEGPQEAGPAATHLGISRASPCARNTHPRAEPEFAE